MALWNYCAVCGKRIESGQPCIGVKEKSDHLCGDSICLNCAKIENLPDGKETVSITDLIAHVEAAEAREKNLIEAAQMITARAEKAEREININSACWMCSKNEDCHKGCAVKEPDCKCGNFKWRGQKEE